MTFAIITNYNVIELIKCMHSFIPQEGDEISRDWTTLFDNNLFKFDTSLIPEAVQLHEKIMPPQIKRGPLTLIPPQVGASWCAS